MTAGERFKNWIEGLSESWKDRLRGWFVSWVVGGMTDALEDMNPEQKSSLDDLLKTIVDDPNTPPYLSRFLGHSTERGNPLIIVAAVLIVPLMLLPMITGAFAPLGNLWNYVQERKLHTHRLDPATITAAWRRDKATYEKLWDDLNDEGWDPDRIKVAKELAKLYPPLADMVRFADYGSFDPAIVKEWREMYDAPGFITEPFASIGITNDPPWEWASKYWFSHWTQPGRFDLNDMFRRGLLSGKTYPAGRTMTPA